MKRTLVFFIVALLFLFSCKTICDCFDEPDYSFGFSVDIKKYDSTISIKEFLRSRDSIGNPKEYYLKVYENDTVFYFDHLDWHGDGKGDSLLIFTIWSPTEDPKIQKVTIDIPRINLNHKLSDFKLEGSYSNGRCACFTPLSKTVVLDDSITFDFLKSGIHF